MQRVPKLSIAVVLLHYNRWANLRFALRALKEQTLPLSEFHIVVADDGSTAWKGRIENNDPAAFEGLVRMLGGRCKAVFEASMNWHVLHDTLSAIDGIEEVVAVHERLHAVWDRMSPDERDALGPLLEADAAALADDPEFVATMEFYK